MVFPSAIKGILVHENRILTLYLYSFSSIVSISIPRWPLLGNRGFRSETLKQIKMASVWETEGLILTDGGSAKSNCFIVLDNSVYVSL